VSAEIKFNVVHYFDATPAATWKELIDWKGHEQWVPMTRVELGPDPQDQPGATFLAFTGVWRLGLKDNMRLTQLDWDEAASTGTCEVEKIGPVLTGRAAFTVMPDGRGSRVDWVEEITAKYAPAITAGVLGKIGAVGFKQGMKRLADLL